MIGDVPICPFCKFEFSKRDYNEPFFLICPRCNKMLRVTPANTGRFGTNKDCEFNKQRHTFAMIGGVKKCTNCDLPVSGLKTLTEF